MVCFTRQSQTGDLAEGIAEQDPHYECFLLLYIITQLLLSPVVSTDALADLENQIARHNELFVELYGSDAYKPTLDMLLHVLEQITRFDTSHHHWTTMRFESKNALPNRRNFEISRTYHCQWRTIFK